MNKWLRVSLLVVVGLVLLLASSFETSYDRGDVVMFEQLISLALFACAGCICFVPTESKKDAKSPKSEPEPLQKETPTESGHEKK